MGIVDAHVHANRLGPNWETADLATTVDLAIATMDAIGVQSTLIAEYAARNFATDPEPHAIRVGEGAWRYGHPFSELAIKLYPHRFGYVMRVDPRDPEAPNLLAELPRKPGSLATRVAPTLDSLHALEFANGGFDPFFGAAQTHGVPIFIFLSDQPEMLIPYARKFSSLPFIIDHWGFPMPAAAADRSMAYFERILALSVFPNVFLKWSKGPRFISSEPYPHSDLIPYMHRSLQSFGAKRIMWGSDNTASKGITSWAEELYHVRDSNALSAAEKAQILEHTARTVLKWPEHGEVTPKR